MYAALHARVSHGGQVTNGYLKSCCLHGLTLYNHRARLCEELAMNCGLIALSIILLAVYAAAGPGVLGGQWKWLAEDLDELYPADVIDNTKQDRRNSPKFKLESRRYEEHSELAEASHSKSVDCVQLIFSAMQSKLNGSANWWNSANLAVLDCS